MATEGPATALDEDVRRRRLVFRAWHRGTREMDLVLGRYADAHAATMPMAELLVFEALMEAPDPEVFAWITGAKPTPANYDTPLLHQIREFHQGIPRG